jgi:hypothetical protein
MKKNMANQKKISVLPANQNAVFPHKRPPVDLRIHGGDLLLSGRFHRWQATAFTSGDLDQLSVRLAIDSTSPDQLTGDGDEGNLFSFHSSQVEQLQPYLYRAYGEMQTTSGAHSLALRVELPEGHNAFFAVSFDASKEVLGDAWWELVTGGGGAGGIEAERLLDPRSAVRVPDLAAA